MSISAPAADERVVNVSFTDDELNVKLMDGLTITAPLAWYPRLLNATDAQRGQFAGEAARGGHHVRQIGVGVGDIVNVEKPRARNMAEAEFGQPVAAFVRQIFGGVKNHQIGIGGVFGEPGGGDQ